MKLPSIELGPKPRKWDLVAAVLALLTLVAAGFNWSVARSADGAIGAGTTGIFVVGQLALASICLLVLGKTAKEGTLWGNLAAVAGLLLGVSGVLLAAAMWVAA
ncbi:MAG: hypothetical protein R2991_13370 [Thermoanaerobaculia bacterium]